MLAVAAAAATFGIVGAKASESGHLKRSFSSPLGRERSNMRSRLRALKTSARQDRVPQRA